MIPIDLDEEEVLRFDGFNDCIIGTACVWDTSGSRHTRVVYDGEKIAASLVRGGLTDEELATQRAMGCEFMTYEDALEYIDFNMEGAYVGPSTPIVAWPVVDE